jgi:hypothetical protein
MFFFFQKKKQKALVLLRRRVWAKNLPRSGTTGVWGLGPQEMTLLSLARHKVSLVITAFKLFDSGYSVIIS